MTDISTALLTSLNNDVNRLSIISQNLANATTSGYKKQIPVNRTFSEYLVVEDQATRNAKQLDATRFEVPYVDSFTDYSMGAVKYTGNPFDLVAQGNSYFSVLTPQGLAYTKQGSFHVDDSGVLVNALGYPVLSESGEIVLNDKSPKIDEQGNISVDDKVISRMRMVTFKPGTSLTNIGFGMYKGEMGTSDTLETHDRIKQGFQEMSNVVLMDEMVKLIEVMRHFETSQKFMLGYDNMLDNAINTMGEV